MSRGVPRARGAPMHRAPRCWVWGSPTHGAPWCMGHRKAGFGVPGAWAPWCTEHPNTEFGVPGAWGSPLTGFGILDAWGTPMHGVLDLGCLMLQGGSRCWGALPLLGLGGLLDLLLHPYERHACALMWGAPGGLCCPSIAWLQELPPSMSLPLSPLPPTPVRPDPCPGAGGPCLVCSPFSPLSSFCITLGGLWLLVWG